MKEFDLKAYLRRVFSYDSLMKFLLLMIVVYLTFIVLAHQDIVANAEGFKAYKAMEAYCGMKGLQCFKCGEASPSIPIQINQSSSSS